MRILVTGGAGFIGSALIRHLISETEHEVLNLDKMTYAATSGSVRSVAENPRYHFVRGDIGDAELVGKLLSDFQPDIIAHLAAESHVDRSIDGPRAFIETNIVGTFVMLQEALKYWQKMPRDGQDRFRFHHISTDEVFGSLGDIGKFTETSPYDPRSPYSASKAGSDQIVRAWWHTYGLPVLVTNCSNNYGPFHFPEKLIPLVIIRALKGDTLPVYGDGTNVRDWLFVEDHARALKTVFEKGVPGETYMVGGNSERRNIDVVRAICDALDGIRPRPDGLSYSSQIEHVRDRPGHDHRYAVDASKIHRELGWAPRVLFEDGIRHTVSWYLDNEQWWTEILHAGHDTERLGINAATVG